MILLPGDYETPSESDRTPIRITVMDLRDWRGEPIVRYRFIDGNDTFYDDTRFAYELMLAHFSRYQFTAVKS
jgi:hypothetical protein